MDNEVKKQFTQNFIRCKARKSANILWTKN